MLLCYLEGKTQDEAARCLGWSLGTFRRRLDQGRELLRCRLTRRGLMLSAVLFPALLAQSALATAPIPLLVSTLQAAMAFAMGEAAALGAVSAKVVILAEEVVKAMMLSKLKFAAATVFLVAGLAGTGTAMHHYAVGAPTREAPVKPTMPLVARLAPPDGQTTPDYADSARVEDLLKFPNQIPPLLSHSKSEPFRFKDLPRYQCKALLPYAEDKKESDLRDFVKKAVQLLIDTKKVFADTLPLLPENQQQRNAVIRGIEQRQLDMADIYAQLDTVYEELKSVEKLRGKETPRWKANYDYVTAHVLIRMVHFYEFQVALGKVRKDDLPAVDKKTHKGYRLVPKAKLSERGDEEVLAQNARKKLERLAEQNKGTPWEFIAQRALETDLESGMDALLTMVWQSIASFQHGLDAKFRPQGECRCWHHRMAGPHAETIALGNRRQGQHGFHHGEAVADANARAAAEGKISELRQAVGLVIGPALRPKFLRLLMEARVAVHHPLAHEKRHPLRKRPAADRHIGQCLSADHVSRRIKPHRLVDNPFGVTQPRQVRHRRGAPGQDFVHFRRQSGLHFRRLR